MNHKFTLWPERLMTSAVGGGAEVTLTDTAKPEPRRGNSVLFLFFFFLSFVPFYSLARCCVAVAPVTDASCLLFGACYASLTSEALCTHAALF